MKLSECKFGVIVARNTCNEEHPVGMVVGITTNIYEEAIPVVKFCDEESERPFHHDHLELHEG